jgi:predicted metalloprotease
MKRSLRLLLASVLVVLAAMLAAGVKSAQAINPEQTAPEGVVNVLKPYVNYYWSTKLTNNGFHYRAPRRIAWIGYASSSCPLTFNNAFYCPTDENIYIDYNLFYGLIHGGSAWETGQRFADDYVAGAIFVHEWGHHISKLLGWRAWAGARRLYAGMELQADCYAGMVSRYMYNRRLISWDDVSWARFVLYNIGDGQATNPDFYDSASSQSHGSGAMRDYWFRVGFYNQSLPACGRNLYRTVHGV